MATTVLSWSGGKDAAYALSELRAGDDEVVELLTTVAGDTGRSSMHGVRRSLYERQAAALGADLRIVTLPPEPKDDTYESVMGEVVAEYANRGIDRLAFADLFLEDVRQYREDRLAESPVDPTFPIWGQSTDEQATAFLEAGFRAVVVAVDGDRLDPSFAGRPFDREFLDSLPETVDPCGERGAFHTFVWDGPIFHEPVPIDVGETVAKPVGDGTYHYSRLRADE
ncbi:adenine nucleotide alpha hydrolase [Salinarchaeum laminariae]|uniref:adenine nucleotide alpha hydrolase n=1 Tax=Salinarchaeum laminariae TaxID=869888 RepID=UPI0020C007EE|nr:adenine nucleotide alpha hydrolase [Salinarchaeum laminariae]